MSEKRAVLHLAKLIASFTLTNKNVHFTKCVVGLSVPTVCVFDPVEAWGAWSLHLPLDGLHLWLTIKPIVYSVMCVCQQIYKCIDFNMPPG